MKTIIKHDKNQGGYIYSHLDPVIDLLLDNGNELKHEYRWGSTREGYFCYLAKPIDFKLLYQYFDFDSSIYIIEDKNYIYCDESGAKIMVR